MPSIILVSSYIFNLFLDFFQPHNEPVFLFLEQLDSFLFLIYFLYSSFCKEHQFSLALPFNIMLINSTKLFKIFRKLCHILTVTATETPLHTQSAMSHNLETGFVADLCFRSIVPLEVLHKTWKTWEETKSTISLFVVIHTRSRYSQI
jgi:hypothetical protein